MPVLLQHRIYRADLKNNPTTLYCFGDNLQRTGLGGQAGEMRGEPNAIGIITKRSPDNLSTSYFCDDDLHFLALLWKTPFDLLHTHLAKGQVVILPSDGLGTGLARLNITAPTAFAHLSSLILALRRS